MHLREERDEMGEGDVEEGRGTTGEETKGDTRGVWLGKRKYEGLTRSCIHKTRLVHMSC